MSLIRVILSKIKVAILNKRIHSYRKIALANLKKNQGLFDAIESYRKKSKSTGVSYSDYWELYQHVRSKKPAEILECGTGVSTVAMAYALMENEAEGGPRGRITSMEEIKEWHDMAGSLMPEHLMKYVDLRLSSRQEDFYSIFRGVRYKETPERRYDFVFVDGPNFAAPSDASLTFNFDYIWAVSKADYPVYGIIDNRLSTSYVFQKIFGVEKVKYSIPHRLCFVGPCCKNDLRVVNTKACFSDSFNLFGHPELHMKMEIPERT